MMAGNLRVIEHNHIIACTTQRDYRCAKWNWTQLRQRFLAQAAPIVVGNRHEGTILISDAENVATSKYLAERLISTYDLSLVCEAVQRFSTSGMRMYENELIALADNLCVKAGNGWSVDHDGI